MKVASKSQNTHRNIIGATLITHLDDVHHMYDGWMIRMMDDTDGMGWDDSRVDSSAKDMIQGPMRMMREDEVFPWDVCVNTNKDNAIAIATIPCCTAVVMQREPLTHGSSYACHPALPRLVKVTIAWRSCASA